MMKRYALVIGISSYTGGSGLSHLDKPSLDAEEVAKVLEQHGDFEVKRLPENWVSRDICEVSRHRPLSCTDLIDALKDFLREQAAGHEALIYFSGHGYVLFDPLTEEAQEGFLATSDCQVTVREKRVIRHNQNSISLRSLNSLIASSKVSSLVVLLDCCHAGSLLESQIIRTTLTTFSGAERSYYFLAACRRAEKAYEGEECSLFTEALLQALKENQARADGRITCDHVFSVVDEMLKGKGQEPVRMGWGQSITLVQYPTKILSYQQPVHEECPYQGLSAFNEETAQFFFGRDQVTETLRHKLDQGNLIPVIGASGSGKSSVVRAGLIPRLKREGWRDSVIFCPSIDPLTELKQALKPLFKPEKLAQVYEWIEGENEGLDAIFEEVGNSERLLLVVDQFEEVFTLCRKGKEAEQDKFIRLLNQIAKIPKLQLTVVITLRADFVEHCLRYESLANLLNQNGAIYIQTLRGSALRDAVVKPAELQGYHLESNLLDAILDDFLPQSESLPLLEFTLTKLWNPATEQGHRLTLAQYEKLGRIRGTLNLHAQEVYSDIVKDFGKQAQTWVKQICLNLVQAGREMKDTRQRRSKNELLSLLTNNSDNCVGIDQILTRLARGGLLTVGGETPACVDLAHEALMEGWETFAKWREEEREILRLRDRVNEEYQEWLDNGKDNNFLMGRGRLAQITKEWSELQAYLTSQVQEFYRLSNEHECKRISLEADINQLIEERLQDLETQLAVTIEKFQGANPNSAAQIAAQFSEVKDYPDLTESDQAKLVKLEKTIRRFPGKARHFTGRMRSSYLAADWLISNQEKLSELLVRYILSQDIRSGNDLPNAPQKLQSLHREISSYINWLKDSLIEGEPIDARLEQPLILTKNVYAEAFRFFMQECLPSEIPDTSMQELKRYIQYLVEYLLELFSI